MLFLFLWTHKNSVFESVQSLWLEDVTVQKARAGPDTNIRLLQFPPIFCPKLSLCV